MFDGIRCEGKLPINPKTSLATYPFAGSARRADLNVEVADRCCVRQVVRFVELMGERCERIEVGTNSKVEGAELEPESLYCQAFSQFPATQVTDDH